MKRGYVYILRSGDGVLYIGSTDDPKRRFYQHRIGHTQTTRNRKINSIALVQEYSSLEEARSVERRLKNMKRKDYLEKMITDGYIKIKAK